MSHANACAHCGHQKHLHATDGPCRVTTISGPPSAKGRARGEHYSHTGRDVTPCDCGGFV